jgi:hypothetical protein
MPILFWDNGIVDRNGYSVLFEEFPSQEGPEQ